MLQTSNICRRLSQCMLRESHRGLSSHFARSPTCSSSMPVPHRPIDPSLTTPTSSGVPDFDFKFNALDKLNERNYVLPSIDRPTLIYTFPMADRATIAEPTPLRQPVVEEPSVGPSYEAPAHQIIEKLAHRMHKVRKRKMKIHKRRKRARRDRVQRIKLHSFKKQRAEAAWRAQMDVLVKEMRAFNAEHYVRDIIDSVGGQEAQAAKAGTSGEIVGKYPHWTELMTVEELYDIPYSDYIDKKTGYTNGEEAKEVIEKRRQFYDKYYMPAK